MLDSLQVEWSTALCSIIDHFLSSLLKTRTSRSDSAASALGFQNQLSGISDTTSETETKVLNLVPSSVSQSAGFSESSDRRKELILLLKNTDANVQCTNINVFMCHEQTGKRLCFYRPQRKFAEVMFLQVSVCPHGGGGRAWLLWGEGHVWLLQGAYVVAPGGYVHGCSQGGVHGFWGGHAVAPGGACVVALGGMHGCSWGGVHGCSGGACVVAPGGACVVAPGAGGMHGCSGGACVVAPGGMHGWGACMVAPGRGMHGCSRGMRGCSQGGHAWLLWEGMCGCSGGVHGCSRGACMVALGGCAWDTTRYGDTINERAVRILLECILVIA